MTTDRLLGLAPVHELRHELDRVFNSFWPDLAARGRAQPFPAFNIWEDAQALHAEAELPGLRLDDLEIFVAGNELTIRGRRTWEKSADVVFHRQERGTGEFSRVLTLPVEIDADHVAATLKDGVLKLTLPKAQVALARKITVKSA